MRAAPNTTILSAFITVKCMLSKIETREVKYSIYMINIANALPCHTIRVQQVWGDVSSSIWSTLAILMREVNEALESSGSDGMPSIYYDRNRIRIFSLPAF